MAVFTWAPDAGARKSKTANIKKTQFGDGYEQRSPDGINYRLETWSVSFTGSLDSIVPISDFLDNVVGYMAFDWETPESKNIRVVCDEFTADRSNPGVIKIDAEFRQVFDLE